MRRPPEVEVVLMADLERDVLVHQHEVIDGVPNLRRHSLELGGADHDCSREGLGHELALRRGTETGKSFADDFASLVGWYFVVPRSLALHVEGAPRGGC